MKYDYTSKKTEILDINYIEKAILIGDIALASIQKVQPSITQLF